jgi:uncharacterized protein (TIGR02597 family)
MIFNRFSKLAASLAVFIASAGLLKAQTAVTDPVGFLNVTLTGSSDTLVSIPFTRPAEFVGQVASVSGSVITISGTPGWTVNQFAYVSGTQPKTYYAILGNNPSTNPKEGRLFTVVANGTGSLTLNLNGEDISGVAASTPVSVIPYWTLATVFPATSASTSFITSSLVSKKTEIYMPNFSGTGINLTAAKVYFFYNNAWRQSGRASSESHDDDVILPGTYFKVRQNSGTSTSLVMSGAVAMGKYAFGLATLATGNQDNYLSTGRPVDMTLNQLGLTGSAGAFTVTTSLVSKKDLLLVYDNSVARFNKTSSATYYYYNSAWRKNGAASSYDAGSEVIPAGSGFEIRKSTSNGATAVWTHSPTY